MLSFWMKRKRRLFGTEGTYISKAHKLGKEQSLSSMKRQKKNKAKPFKFLNHSWEFYTEELSLALLTLLRMLLLPGLILFSRKGGNEAGQRSSSVGKGMEGMVSLGREEVAVPISCLQVWCLPSNVVWVSQNVSFAKEPSSNFPTPQLWQAVQNLSFLCLFMSQVII